MEYQNFSLIKEDIQADACGRISLGTECSNRHYRILMNASGELLLVPIVAIPEGELWAFQNPSVRESLKRGLAAAHSSPSGIATMGTKRSSPLAFISIR